MAVIFDVDTMRDTGFEAVTEETSELFELCIHHVAFTNATSEEFNIAELRLPRWDNRVNLIINHSIKIPLNLRLLGRRQNWQRRLGYNYTVLHVKGDKKHEVHLEAPEYVRD